MVDTRVYMYVNMRSNLEKLLSKYKLKAIKLKAQSSYDKQELNRIEEIISDIKSLL